MHTFTYTHTFNYYNIKYKNTTPYSGVQHATAGSQLRIFANRGLSHNKAHIHSSLIGIKPGMLFFRYTNGGNITGMFVFSLLLSLMMIVSRSYKQKRGIIIFLRRRVGI